MYGIQLEPTDVTFEGQKWNHKLSRMMNADIIIPVLLPHTLLWALCHSGVEQFRRSIVGRSEANITNEIMEFWEMALVVLYTVLCRKCSSLWKSHVRLLHRFVFRVNQHPYRRQPSLGAHPLLVFQSQFCFSVDRWHYFFAIAKRVCVVNDLFWMLWY